MATGIARDNAGNAVITGATDATDFPTRSALQFVNAAPGYDNEAYVAKLNPSASALVYSTYLGGSSDNEATGVTVDSYGNAYVTGYTSSSDFPTVNAYQSMLNGTYNAFVAKIAPLAGGDQRVNDTDSTWLDDEAASVAPNTGTLSVSLPLDFSQSQDGSLDDSAGFGITPALVYDSDRVNVRPIGEVTPQFPAVTACRPACRCS